MVTSDSYFTIKTEGEVAFKIKSSRFIGRTFLCHTVKQAEKVLENLRKKFHDATHHCYAYRIGWGKEMEFRYSDDGEPNGTAGKPIYDRIEGLGLTDVLVVVTRYYGGVKLGTGGLTHAYSRGAGDVLERAGKVENYITGKLKVFLDFSDYNQVERLIDKYNGKRLKSDFTEKVALVVEMRESFIAPFIKKLTDLTSGRAKYERES
jgi:uncharacterized YigZ family protein